MEFKSRVSYGLLLFIALAFFGPLFMVWQEEGFSSKWLISTGLLLFLFCFIIYLFYHTSYTLKEGFLIPKVGPFKYPPIAISEIYEIRRSRSLLAAPAASLQRLELSYSRFQSQLVSPAKEDAFIAALQEVNPQIKLTL